MQIIRRLRRTAGRFARNTRGVAAVELGLIAPMLVGIIVPMIDLGVGAYDKMQVQNAAESGAQYALEHGWNLTAVESAATNTTSLTGVTATATEACYCPSSGVMGSAVECGPPCGDGSTAGTYVSVSTQMTYNLLVSYPAIGSTMTLSGSSMVRIQ